MDKVYKCDICKKNYKSYQSLWKHKKLLHNQKVINDNHPDNHNIIISDYPAETNKYKCKYCDKDFKYNQNKWRHEKKCENTYKQNINELKEENKILKKDMDELKKMMNELLNKNCKMHYKTLQKINNSGNMNTGTINNTINIMALGQENIDEVLSKTDKIAILNKKENALPYMIEMVHFNDKYPQFKNIAITNNRTKQAYLYDTINKVFKMVDKEELIEELIDYRVCDIEDYYMQYKDELELPVKYKIEELIEHRGEDDITKDKIKLLLFNNRHKIKV